MGARHVGRAHGAWAYGSSCQEQGTGLDPWMLKGGARLMVRSRAQKMHAWRSGVRPGGSILGGQELGSVRGQHMVGGGGWMGMGIN